MIDRIDYYEEADGIVIVRCYGSGIMDIPEKIAGMEVRGLSDHCFALEPSEQCRRPDIRSYDLGLELTGIPTRPAEKAEAAPGSDAGGADANAACADRITEVILPRTMKRIGSYAFYGCRQMERITFPCHAMRLGSGIFVSCGHLHTLAFRGGSPGRTPAALREMLGEIDGEVEVIVEGYLSGQEGNRQEENRQEENRQEESRHREYARAEHSSLRILFPGYYEESVENTPARLFVVHFEGTGYKYRQAFRNGEIDFHQYDSLFYETSVQEKMETVLRTALDRVLCPVNLSAAARAKYMAFLRKEYRICADYLLTPQRTESALRLLELLLEEKAEKDMPENEQISDAFLAAAQRRQNTRAASSLMDLMRRRRGKKEEKYVL